MRRRIVAVGLLLGFGLPFLFAQAESQASPSTQKPEVKKAPEEPKARAEDLVPSPRNARERSAILVFVAWLWAVIAGLLVVVRLKIREVDRLFNLEHPAPRDVSPEDPPA
jgi:hypothetical protein